VLVSFTSGFFSLFVVAYSFSMASLDELWSRFSLTEEEEGGA